MDALQKAIQELTDLGDREISHKYNVNGNEYALTGPASAHKEIILLVTNKIAGLQVLEAENEKLKKSLEDLEKSHEAQIAKATKALDDRQTAIKALEEIIAIDDPVEDTDNCSHALTEAGEIARQAVDTITWEL